MFLIIDEARKIDRKFINCPILVPSVVSNNAKPIPPPLLILWGKSNLDLTKPNQK